MEGENISLSETTTTINLFDEVWNLLCCVFVYGHKF